MTDLITDAKDERLDFRHKWDAEYIAIRVLRDSLRAALEKIERTERMWSEDRAAVKDWAAASDAIGELYEILNITKDSAGFEDGFTKIVAATRAALTRAEEAEGKLCAAREALEEYVKWNGGVHIGRCPGDDTCSCAGKSINDKVNAALSSSSPCRHAAKDARIAELECQKKALQQVNAELEYQNKSVDKYLLEGIVFRDELQARIALAEKVVEAARVLSADAMPKDCTCQACKNLRDALAAYDAKKGG